LRIATPRISSAHHPAPVLGADLDGSETEGGRSGIQERRDDELECVVNSLAVSGGRASEGPAQVMFVHTEVGEHLMPIAAGEVVEQGGEVGAVVIPLIEDLSG
jgi:hypothetical protein